MKYSPKTLIIALFITSAICACQAGGKPDANHSEASVGGGSTTPDLAISLTPDAIARGRGTYMSSCAACHGSSGRGDGPAAPALAAKPRDHTNGAYMDKLTNSHIFKVIKFGGVMFGYPAMPAQPSLSDDEVKDVIAFVRTLSTTYRAS